MKLLVIGDLHGNKPKIHYKEFDAIIAPGDFCSDALRKYFFESIKQRKENPDSYKEWYEILGNKKATQMLDKSLKDGRKILEFLNSLNVPVFLVPGNWDQHGYKKSKLKREKENNWKRIISGLENIKDVHFRRENFNKCHLIGYGIVSGPEIPRDKDSLKYYNKKELRDLKKEYKNKKEKLSKIFNNCKETTIFIPHNIPFNTKLDKITNKDSPAYGKHYGSVIAREIIEKHQPLLAIGGHMHEHFGKCKIGKTTVINAGFGSKVNTLIDIDEKKGRINSIKFYPKPYG